MLTINPNTPQTAVVNHSICFEASGLISIPERSYFPMEIAASGSGWTYDSVTERFTRVSGGPSGFVSATASTIIYSGQPFWIRFNNVNADLYAAAVGVIDDAGNKYAIEVVNTPTNGWNYAVEFCPPSPAPCGPTRYNHTTGLGHTFYVWSDGRGLAFEDWVGGTYQTGWGILLSSLPSTQNWRFYAGATVENNVLASLETRLGTFQGPVPVTWSTPSGGTLTGIGNSRCFSANVPGSYQVCVDTEVDEPLCVDIEVSDLFLQPVGLYCNECVFVNQVVEFESNGGTEGTLTVTDGVNPVGTVIDSLTWQAPNFPVFALATYTLGDYSVNCYVKVVEEFKITNVDGDTITGLVPGDTFQIETNYPLLIEIAEDNPNPPPWARPPVTWTNLTCQNLVTPEGLVTIPKYYNNECFGEIDCWIRVTVNRVPGYACPNLTDGSYYKDIRIIVDPVYPTPELGGPNWHKWKPETPDFRVLSRTMEGGCAETHIRNKVPVMRWTVDYQGLRYEDEDDCGVTCCEEDIGFVGGFDPKFKTAKMLDRFWMLVAGQYGSFTLIDPKDGTVWRKVRFDGTMERDHINWNRVQSRTLKFIWNPCCDVWPMGGTCVHTSTITDNIPPTVPGNLLATGMTESRIQVQWDAAIDNVGIRYYELEIDGVITNVGNVLYYQHTGLSPVSTHFYRVRAVDYSNNRSAWSAEVQATTLTAVEENAVIQGEDEVFESADLVIQG